MPDDYTILNPGADGDAMDETGVDFGSAPLTRKRPRVVLGGAAAADLAAVKNTGASAGDYGLVVRPVPVASGPGSPVAAPFSVTLVPYDTETVIGTYNVSGAFYFTGFTASGDVNGRFSVYLDDVKTIVVRTTAAYLNVQLDTGSVRLTPATSVKITVIHNDQGLLPNFDGTVLGYLG